MIFEKTITIKAPVYVVWEVMRHVESWSEWTPTITSIEKLTSGPLREGSYLRIQQPKLQEATWKVFKLEDYKGFSMCKGNFFLKVVLGHELQQTENGTRVLLSVSFSGLLAKPVGKRYGPMMEDYLAAEANGLKKRSESAVLSA